MTVALVMQHALRMRCSMLSCVAYLDVQHFPPLCHKGHDFGEKKVIEHECVFWFSVQTKLDTF